MVANISLEYHFNIPSVPFCTCTFLFFRCLHKFDGVLPFTPQKSCQVTTACMRLHNICMEMDMPVPDSNEEVQGDNCSAVFMTKSTEQPAAIQICQTLINSFS